MLRKSEIPRVIQSDEMPLFDFTTMRTLVSGAIFGAALTAAGVYQPSIIVGQLKMEDFTMLKVFLTATAASSLVIPLARYFNPAANKSGSSFSIGFYEYDANILGGALLGTGMALTGACPGTVLPQIVTGVRSGTWVAFGGLIGADQFLKYVFRPDSKTSCHKIEKEMKVNRKVAILGYQVACGTVVAAAMLYQPGSLQSLVTPVIGGLLIGASQAANLLLTGRTQGVSTAYEQAVLHFYWVLDWLCDRPSPKPDSRSIVFVSGIILGSFTLKCSVILPAGPVIDIGIMRAVFGGALLVFGARLASGCTSGHGISGMAQLSKSSFFTVAAMFGAGMAVSCLEELIKR